MRLLPLAIIIFFGQAHPSIAKSSFQLHKPEVSTADDIFTSRRNQWWKINDRYQTHASSPQTFFTKEELYTINDLKIAPIIDKIILHKVIKLSSSDVLLDVAKKFHDSGYPFENLEPHTTRYMKRGDMVFSAIDRAIDRERKLRWQSQKIKSLTEGEDSFLKKIYALHMNAADKEKVVSTYALCVAGFRDKEFRQAFLTPNICPGNDTYKTPVHAQTSMVRTKYSRRPNGASQAFIMLLDECQTTAQQLNLSGFEKIKMANCIAERTTFFSADKKPLKALRRSLESTMVAPDKAFYQKDGVCTNISGLSFHIANNLGLKGKVYLARHYVHTYLEVEIDGMWYHSHPFFGKSHGCDIIEFSKKKYTL